MVGIKGFGGQNSVDGQNRLQEVMYRWIRGNR